MKWSYFDRVIATWVCLLATCAIIIVLAGLCELIGNNSPTIASWFQAIGSIGAIFGAASVANIQHKRDQREKSIRDNLRNLQYAEICMELCLAVESIANYGKGEWNLAANEAGKQGALNSNKFLYHVERATSTYRLENLQSSILSLLQKEMPSELMRVLFSLQKNLAIYAGAISAHHTVSDRFELLDFDKVQQTLSDAISKVKDYIKEFKAIADVGEGSL